MFTLSNLNRFLTGLLVFIWLANGIYCKILGAVSRHEEIVANILGAQFAPVFTNMIGVGEVLIAIWILSGLYSKFCSIFQMIMIGVMNVIEFFVVPDLLLWGRLNILFACLLVALIYYREFVLRPSLSLTKKDNLC